MRAVVERVSEASVLVDGKEVARIGHGLVVLLAVLTEDALAEAQMMAEKIIGLRIFRGAGGPMDRSVSDEGGSLLVVSQFTLAARLRKGRRPEFTRAARPEHAEPLVEAFIRHVRERGVPVASGVFGAMMQVALVNDGPVTFILDTDALKEPRRGTPCAGGS
ncbi:MAG: D-aminoacyl-tRNA deacylase [Planctomycetota bacterium]